MSGDVNKLCLACMQYGLNEQGVCTLCGASAAGGPQMPHHLAPRTVLNGKYLSARVLGEGGFGITYLGWDINLEVKVAIKEYYPLGAVTRNTTVNDQITAVGGPTTEFFNQGRERFIDEARRLARFYSLPGIVSVKDFFLENGTAYIVMEFVEGITLKDYLDQNGGRLPETTVLELMKPLIHSLAEVHRAGVIHRDISPDNIMIGPDGQLRLIDFGAARDFQDENKSLSVLLKPGYAPEEQYRSRGKQGPWTDVYALSATIFRAIEGDKPPESMERMFEDSLTGFSLSVSQNTHTALMKGLSVRYEGRWQNMEQLYAALYSVSQTPPLAAVPPMPPVPAQPQPVAGQPSQPGYFLPGQPSVAGQPPAASQPLPMQPPQGYPMAGQPYPGQPPAPKPSNKRLAVILLVVGVLAIALVATLFAARGGGASPSSANLPGGAQTLEDASAAASAPPAVQGQMVVDETKPSGYGLSVNVLDDTHAIFRLTVPDIQPEYQVNTSPEGDFEYLWGVDFGEDNDFSIAVWNTSNGTPETVDVTGLMENMESDFWAYGSFAADIVPVFEVMESENKLLIEWDVTAPEDVLSQEPGFSFYSFDEYELNMTTPEMDDYFHETFYAPGAGAAQASPVLLPPGAATGGVYTGETNTGGFAHGLGTWTFENYTYDGEWQNGMPNGSGTLHKRNEAPEDLEPGYTYATNQLLTGIFVDGLAHGSMTWIWYMDDGGEHQWRFDVRNGHALQDGSVTEINGDSTLGINTADVYSVPPWGTESTAAPEPAGGQEPANNVPSATWAVTGLGSTLPTAYSAFLDMIPLTTPGEFQAMGFLETRYEPPAWTYAKSMPLQTANGTQMWELLVAAARDTDRLYYAKSWVNASDDPMEAFMDVLTYFMGVHGSDFSVKDYDGDLPSNASVAELENLFSSGGSIDLSVRWTDPPGFDGHDFNIYFARDDEGYWINLSRQ